MDWLDKREGLSQKREAKLKKEIVEKYGIEYWERLNKHSEEISDILMKELEKEEK